MKPYQRRKWLGINWKVLKGFREDDPDWCDWYCESRKGKIHRLGGNLLSVVIETAKPNLTKNKLLENIPDLNYCQFSMGDGELYIDGTTDHIDDFFRAIGKTPKSERKKRVITDEQRAALALRLEKARSQRRRQ